MMLIYKQDLPEFGRIRPTYLIFQMPAVHCRESLIRIARWGLLDENPINRTFQAMIRSRSSNYRVPSFVLCCQREISLHLGEGNT